MLLLNSQLQNVPVMSLQSGTQLGIATQPIIDPRKLAIVAYYVEGPRVTVKSVVHTSDVREFGQLGFIVDGADSVMELDEDLVRLKEVVNFNFSLLGKMVVDDTKKRLGKINEYTVEVDGFTIQKLHVAQTVIKNFTNSNLIIHRSQIIEVTDTKIIVKSASIPEATSLAQVINPFRKNQSTLTPESTKH